MSVRNNYTMINIREYLALGTDEEVGEPALVRLLSDFSCPKNPDVEYFLNHQIKACIAKCRYRVEHREIYAS